MKTILAGLALVVALTAGFEASEWLLPTEARQADIDEQNLLPTEARQAQVDPNWLPTEARQA